MASPPPAGPAGCPSRPKGGFAPAARGGVIPEPVTPFSPHPEGCLLLVRAVPRAGREAIGPVENGALKVRLAAPPVEGKANQALLKLLAKALGMGKGRLRLVSGEKSRDKKVLLPGISPEEAARRLLP